MSYNRYTNFVNNGRYEIVPFIKIPITNLDCYEYYDCNKNRLDMISYKYYGDSNYDWLIMLANPEYGSMEFDIPNNTLIRIPYPLKSVLDTYNNSVANYKYLNKK